MEERRVCVTGAGGYIASWVVKFLLSRGYTVNGTVRDPGDPKNAHLRSLENAEENLKLFKADLLDYEGISVAISGCAGVLHIASPVPIEKVVNPEVDLYEPALTGTKNVLNACLKEKVKKVVVVSSIAAVAVTETWPKDQAMDETCWSDLERCKSLEQWYCIAKTLAETEAWEFAKRTGLNLVTVCPSIVIGPMLQSTLNASSMYLLVLMQGLPLLLWRPTSSINYLFPPDSFGMAGTDPGLLGGMAFVDVRDTAEAILLAYENHEAEGRYICSSYEMRNEAIVEMLKEKYPEYDYPKTFNEVLADVKLSTQKLQNLGWKYRPFDETLVDAVENFKQSGALP